MGDSPRGVPDIQVVIAVQTVLGVSPLPHPRESEDIVVIRAVL
jgi:hypothetical protein